MSSSSARVVERQSRKGILSSDDGEAEAYFDFTQAVSSVNMDPATFIKIRFELMKLGDPGTNKWRDELSKFVGSDDLKGVGAWVRSFCSSQVPPAKLGFKVQSSGSKDSIARSALKALDMIIAFAAARSLLPPDTAELSIIDDGLNGRINNDAAKHTTLLKLIDASVQAPNIDVNRIR